MNPGNQLGPYQILELLSTGGMGEVYRAHDPRIGREVAIKVILTGLTGDVQLMQRFEQEARAAGALDHPNILVIHDIGEQDGSPYLVSELLQGETLRERLIAGAIPLKKALDLAVQVTEGLAAAHEKGIIHRDLKPENIFITRDGRAKILDFGLAKLTRPEVSIPKPSGTESGTVLGTVGYMSPEQVRGENTDHRSDIFSFGAILYEMLSGKRAFDGPTAVEKMTAILNEDPLPIGNLNIPIPLRWVVEHSLAKDLPERYGATVDLNHDLRNLRDHFADISSTGSVAMAAPRKRPLLLICLFAFALLLIGFAGASLLLPAPEGIDLSSFQITRVSDGTRYENYGAWSPNGMSIVYAAGIDGILQIFTRRLDSPIPTQLTQSPIDCRSPFWSPDGRRIYYLSSPNFDRTPGDLYVVGAAGGSPQMLAKNVSSATISGDGKTLFFSSVSEKGLMHLWTSSPPGASPLQYTKSPFNNEFPATWLAFSPDGSRLGLLFVDQKDGEFWTIGYPDGSPQRVASDLPTYNLSTFSWMSNDSIIFVSGERLWLLDTRSKRHYPITGDTMEEGNPAVSPEGRILFTSTLRQYDVIQVSLEGAPARDLTATDLTEGAPSESPDGSLLVYSSRRNSSDVILLRNTKDMSERVLVTPADFREEKIHVSRVAFSPDGRRIAYKVWCETGPNSIGAIYVSTIIGGQPIPLLLEKVKATQSSPSWSPDGNWIAFIRASNEALPGWDLLKIKVLSDEHPVLLKKDIGYNHPQWSPKGDWIACQGYDGLYLFSKDGTNSRMLNRQSWITYGWSKNGGLLYGVKRNEKAHLALASIDVNTGAEKMLGDLGPSPIRIGWDPLMGFSLAPDGKSFTTSILRQKANLWILDGIHPPRTLRARLLSR